MTEPILCAKCGTPYPGQGTPFHCSCGGFYTLAIMGDFTDRANFANERSLWKYQSTFPYAETLQPITLGEGNTPLVSTSNEGKKVFLKLEYANPTGSYKDRGTAVLISFLKSRGVRFAVEDSSGNAGASFAAYAARAGIKARVYVPGSASGPKRKQIEAYGAELVSVQGPRSEAAKKVLEAASQGSAYASHAYMPFGLAGIATIAYEIVEQLGSLPGTVIAPVGHGGLLYGIMAGFRHLVKQQKTANEPFYLGVQAAGCSPVSAAYKRGELTIAPVDAATTIAEGVRVSQPAKGEAILHHLRETQGKIIDIGDDDLKSAYVDLSRKGFFVEPTSALVWAAYLKEWVSLPDPVVMIMTGSGLKTESLLD